MSSHGRHVTKAFHSNSARYFVRFSCVRVNTHQLRTAAPTRGAIVRMHDASMEDAPARAARIDAPLLNARLSKAQDADELLALFARHGWQMDGMLRQRNLWGTAV